MQRTIENFTVRRFSCTDEQAVLAINEETFARPWSSEAVASYLLEPDKFGVVLADANRRIMAFALCEMQPEQLYISLLATDHDFRECGLGTALVRAIQDAMPALGRSRIELHVYSKDLAPQRLYAKTGFRLCAEKSGYYPDGVSALMMRWELGNQ